MMQQSIKNGGGESAVIIKDSGPVFVGLVRCDDHRPAFVPFADDLEQEIGPLFVKGQINPQQLESNI